LLRPGRFDLILKIPPPDVKARLAILGVHTREKPLAPDVDLNTLSKATEGFSGAELEALCREAAMLAVRNFIIKGKTDIADDFEAFKITRTHFHEAKEMRYADTKVKGE
jgi:transitional endoplasmic reticulum ATPase